MINLFGSLALDFFAFAAVISSLLVITAKNPVISVLFLISVFVNSAIYLMFLGVSFVGISYIIIYVGAIAILFLFILMMINIKLTDILEIGTDYTKNLPLALIIGAIFILSIFSSVLGSNLSIFQSSLSLALLSHFNIIEFINYLTTAMAANEGPGFLSSLESAATSDTLSLHLTNNPLNLHIIDFTQIEALGHNLYTHSALLLIITSFILLLSMLAPIILSNLYKKG
jgi:NADH-ubiquinone oxidoreductase chain 6